MSTPSKKDIIYLKLARANRTLAEASNLIENNFAHAALNRLYYACFYAASALLYDKDVIVKSHSGIRQMLGKHYISTSILSLESGRFYSEIFDLRQHADYDDFAEPDITMVKELFIQARQFVAGAQTLLKL